MWFNRGRQEAFPGELFDDARFAVLVAGALELALSAPPLSTGGLVLGAATALAANFSRIGERLRFVASGSVCAWLLLTPSAVEALTLTLTLAFLLPSQALVPCLLAAVVFRTEWPMPLVAIAAAGIAVLQARRRLERGLGYLKLVESTQELRLDEARALAAGHAKSQERLAAAISHEVNTPVGAIRSAAQTMRSVARKLVTGSEEERKKAAAVHEELTDVLMTSTERVQAIVTRLQRLTSLDRALVRTTDVNGVLRDIAASLESESSNAAAIRLNLHSIPTVVCETQAWTTILSHLIRSAAAHRHQRSIEISTAFENNYVVVEIIEVGRDVPPPATVEPAFVENGGRIETTNWTMFHVRSWIQQLGGEIKQSSDRSRGLTTRILIPANIGSQAKTAAR